MNENSTVVLLAEDDPDDRYLISEALDESHQPIQLFIVSDGEEMLDFLYRRGKYTESEEWPMPRLILLDLNMPRKDGREVLVEIKNHPDFRRIPVIILTTSRAEDDILRSYDLGVSGYISKPVSFGGWLDIMKSLGTFWLNVLELPPPL